MKTDKIKIQYLKDNLRNIPDFPVKGIQFKDVTTLFKEKEVLDILTEELVREYKDKGITKVVGIESRGFIMGPILALKLGAGFIPIRKPGKLPAPVFEESYEKEYGLDTIQIHQDAVSKDDVVLIHDDLLATGGTMKAAYKLLKRIGVKDIHINILIELEDLKGRELFDSNIKVSSLLKYPI